jgi:MFS family permease
MFEPRYYIRQYTHLQYPAADASDDVKGLFVLPGWQQSLLTGILSCGTFFGALIAGDVADRIGRRWTIISGCLTFTVGCILETASTTLPVMVVGRLIAGAGVGFISAISKFFFGRKHMFTSTN